MERVRICVCVDVREREDVYYKVKFFQWKGFLGTSMHFSAQVVEINGKETIWGKNLEVEFENVLQALHEKGSDQNLWT